jgi:glycosyltransferase involved in cell wall biosynthesis
LDNRLLSAAQLGTMKQLVTFEVRIPTYNRPEMLRRALNSLQVQTYPYWTAMVFDDASSPESREVVDGFANDRISYWQNHRRLGAAANIDQCFSPIQRSGGDYACLLEDDNFWLPDFLSLVAHQLETGSWSLILANQRISEEGFSLLPASETTRGNWFKTGRISPLELRATLLLMEGLSNGGLVWRLGGETDLRVGSKVQETGLHEACRSLLVVAPFLFIEEPQAVWTSMPKANTARETESNRVINRGMQSIRDFVLQVHGESVVRAAMKLALQLGLSSQLVDALAYSGRLNLVVGLLQGRLISSCRAFVKGSAIRFVEKDPCMAFLKTVPTTII